MRQNYRFVLLAPPQKTATSFHKARKSPELHRRYLADMQRLRGSVYLKDGAIQACELDDEGRFRMRGDDQSWHLLLVDDTRNVIGCARYLLHPNTVSFESLRISHSALAKHPTWGPKVREAVQNDLGAARAHNFSYVELGGWALAEEWRGSRAALEILVGSYALTQLWGGALGACTATVRHGSSSILRRSGGRPLRFRDEDLPAYEDPQYGCQMELLHFDSRTPAARFQPLIAQLKEKLADIVPVTSEPARDWFALPNELGSGNLAALRMAPLYR